jgi:hypothetical protein
MGLAQKTSSMGSLENVLEKIPAVGGLFLIFCGREKFQRRRRKIFFRGRGGRNLNIFRSSFPQEENFED